MHVGTHTHKHAPAHVHTHTHICTCTCKFIKIYTYVRVGTASRDSCPVSFCTNRHSWTKLAYSNITEFKIRYNYNIV